VTVKVSENVSKRLKRLEQKVGQILPKDQEPYYLQVDPKRLEEAMAILRTSAASEKPS
jgi:hypothetical protein